MFNSLLGSSHLAASQQAAGLQNAYNQHQTAAGQHAANMYAQQFQHANAALQKHQHKFMIDGRTMTFDQFLDEVAPEPGAMRTFLTLKYQR